MGGIDVLPSTRPVARRAVGWTVVVLAAATAVLAVLGAWNPWDLVVLWRWFGNPPLGATVFFALALLASWLLAPVSSEAVQVGRTRWRVTFVIGLVVSVLALGLFWPALRTDYVTVARSPDGRFTVVLHDPGTDMQRLRVWAGTGLGRRDAGDLGHPCGATTVTFRAAGAVRVATSYGQWDLRLDPDTGHPLDRLGSSCRG